MEPVRRYGARGRSHVVYPGGDDDIARVVATGHGQHVFRDGGHQCTDQRLERLRPGHAPDITDIE